VSAATLSKVENGRAGLGADTLVRIAAGLDVSLVTLLEDDASPRERARRSVSATRSSRHLAIPGYDLYYMAADVLRKRLVPMLIRVSARTLEEAGGLRFHEGEEVYYVVSGSAMLHTSDYAPLAVRTGECVFMDGRTPHAFTARGGDAVIFSVNEGHTVYSAATGTVFDAEKVARKTSNARRAEQKAASARGTDARSQQRSPGQR
jgi:transcriptional regulator with XRE-family HTH domain